MIHADQSRFADAVSPRPGTEPRTDDLARLLAELVGLNAILPPTKRPGTERARQD